MLGLARLLLLPRPTEEVDVGAEAPEAAEPNVLEPKARVDESVDERLSASRLPNETLPDEEAVTEDAREEAREVTTNCGPKVPLLALRTSLTIALSLQKT